MSVFDAIRAAAARVMDRARSVRVHEERLAELAEEFARDDARSPSDDPAHHRMATPAATLAYVVTLDAVNFGSGWFPHLRKRAGRSGYFTIAGALRDHCERHGPLDAEALQAMSAERCAAIFEQAPAAPPVDELMALFARSLSDLGRHLLEHHGGSFEALVGAAGGQAETLVALLAEMPLYRDVSFYAEGSEASAGFEVPFYKRAQITCADLAAAFDGLGPGAFDDLDRLTVFADNLVPHVLRWEGALQYEDALLDRIERGELIAPHSREEIEIRCAGVHAVEMMCARLRASGVEVEARQLDHWLWHRGQSPRIKASPRHRTRSVFY